MKAVIGFDTSCYTTSVALVACDGSVLGSFRRLLPVEGGERGLRQSEGVFLHVKQLPLVISEMKKTLPDVEIIAVGATDRPRDDVESYMPVFMAGLSQGKVLAEMLGIPFFTYSHQRGHLQAARLGSELDSKHFLALHLSGGTTEMLDVNEMAINPLGGTKDLHAGQLVDRTGVVLGLSFPSGPQLEQLAQGIKAQSHIPTAMEDAGLFCHLSGAEAQIMRWVNQGKAANEIAAEVYDFLARTVTKMVLAGVKRTNIKQVLLTGGVASSLLFRQLLIERLSKANHMIQLHFGLPEYSGDNAVGIATLALCQLRKE